MLKKVIWEGFCRGLADGLPRAEALRAVKPKCKNHVKAAYKLWQRKEIQDRVKELIPIAQKNAEITAIIDRGWVIAEMVRLGKAAEEKGELNTARLCIRDVGDAIHVFEKNNGPKFDWSGDPAELTDSQLERFTFAVEKWVAGEEKAKEYQQKRMQKLNGAVIDVAPQPVEDKGPEW